MSPMTQVVRRDIFNTNTPLKIWEVAPRDGLQNEKNLLSLEAKHELLKAMISAGLRHIEVGSFITALPQMADTDALVHALAQHPLRRQVQLTGLIFNSKGLQRAVAAGVDGVCVPVFPSETLSRKNTGLGAQEALQRALDLVDEAQNQKLFIRVDLSTAWVCPFEGAISQERVLEFASCFLSREYVNELALADTIGHAHPLQVQSMFAILADKYGSQRLAAHFHDTLGFALANVVAAYSAGVRIFDSALGGLGGCPFAQGAAGNLATEDLVLMAQKFSDSGVAEIQLEKLWSSIAFLEKHLGRSLGGRSRLGTRATRNIES